MLPTRLLGLLRSHAAVLFATVIATLLVPSAARGALPSVPAGSVFQSVPEVANYGVVYELNPPNSTQYNFSAIAYAQDNSAAVPASGFTRIAYALELNSTTIPANTKWVWVSFDRPSNITSASKIGVPNTASGEFYHYPNGTAGDTTIANMNVFSNVSGVTTGTGISTGNIEFWHFNYDTGNAFGVPGASASTFDFGDSPFSVQDYGSMQINNYGAQQTIFAFNDWGNTAASSKPALDIGIGNQVGGSGHPDWTFAANAGSYVLKHIYVLVQAGPTITSATSATARLNNPFSYPITATNSPTSFNAAGLPAGLSVNPVTGIISGTPTATGTSNVTLSATNALGTGTATLTLIVQQLQTLTIEGTDVASGTIDPNTDCSRDGDVTWLPAYAASGAHPWGNISGTTGWISRIASMASDPTTNGSHPETLDFRIRFFAPSDITNAQLTYQLNADNLGDILLNGTKLNASQVVGNPGVDATATITNANIVAGLNTIIVRLTDTGGLLGINYRVDMQGYGSTAFQRLTAPPAVTNLTSSIANASYKAGITIPIQVTFTNAVTVTGAPTFTLATGTARTATYASGSGTTSLTFNYTVQAGDNSADLDCASASALALSGGTIISSAADAQAANLTLPAPGASGSLSANKTLVIDTTAPSLSVPGHLTFEATSASGATVNFAASATDNFGTPTIAYTKNPGTVYAFGNYTIGVTATDSAGNAASNTFGVTVNDTTKPTITAPSNRTVEATSSAGAVVSFAATATDAVTASPTITYSQNPGTTFPLGPTAVTITATDAASNAQTATFTVTVSDTTKPVITPPANLTAEATGASGAVVSFTATATDAVTTSPTITYSKNPGTTFPIGLTPVTITATDAAGNAQTASFTVTVRDTTKPVLTLPANITAEATSPTGATVAFSATATDGVSGSVPVTLTPASGSMFPLGNTTVTATATDVAGNVASGSFTVTVRDTTPPVISVTTGADFSENFSGYTPGAGATNSQYQSGLTVGFSGDLPGWTKSGLHAIHAVDLDGHGNWAPMIWQDNVITSIRTTADNASGTDYIVHFNAGPAVDQDTSQLTSATDGLLIQILRADNSVLSQFTYHPGAWTGAPALVPVSFHYTGDGSGAVHLSVGPSAPNSGRFGGTIDDISVTPSTPANISLEATSPAGAVATFTATAADLVSNAVAVTASPVSGGTFAIGTTPVTLAAVDGAGNHATATFNVIVTDTIKPALAVPANIIAEATSAAGALVNFVATSTDAASTPAITYSQNPGTVFALGATTVNVTATDGSGNVQTGSFTITVKPIVATITLTTPTYTYDGGAKSATGTTAPAGLPVTFTYDGGSTSAPVNAGTRSVVATVSQSWVSGSATGTLTINPASETIFFNNTTQTYNGTPRVVTVATNPNGVAAASVVVTYSGSTTAPTNAGTYTLVGTFSDPNYQGTNSTTLTVNKASASVALANNIQFFDGTPKTMTVTTTPAGLATTVTYNGSATPPSAVGTYSVVATVNDTNYSGIGNGVLSIRDNTPPVLSLPANLTVEATSFTGTIVTFSGSATDNVDGSVPVTFTPASGSAFPLGTTTVNATARDAAGNTAHGSFTAMVVDTTKPTLTLPSDITVTATGASGAVVNFTATATDAVGGPIFSSDFETPAIGSNSFRVVASNPTTGATLGGWNFLGSGGFINGNGGGYGAPLPVQGSQAVFIQHPQEGWLSQMESAATFPVVAGQTYVVSFVQATRPSYGPLTYDVTLNGNGARTEIFRRTTGVNESWARYVATFIATASGDYTIAFNVVSTPLPTDDATFFIDDVHVYGSTVPVVAAPASGSIFPLGTTTVNATATDAAGNVQTGSFNVTVNAAIASITLTTPAYTFDGMAKVATATTNPAGLPVTFTYDAGSASAPVNAGSHAVTATVDLPWISGSATGTVEIAKAEPIIAITPYSATYDGDAHTATGTATGAGGALLAGLDLTGTTHTAAGTFADAWIFTDATGNYNSPSGTIGDTIAKAAPSITVSPYAVTFDGNSHSATGGVRGVKNEGLFGLALGGTVHTNAGAFADAWTFTDTTGNYLDAAGTVSDSITKATAVVTVTPYSVTFDGNAHSATGSVAGVGGTSLAGLNLTATAHTNAGTFTDAWTFTDTTGNYVNASGSVSDAITKASATTTVTPYSVTYDAHTHLATGTAIGVKGETLAGLDLSGTMHTGAGAFTDGWTFTDSTGNYVNDSGAVSDTIAKADAFITVNGYSGVYDGLPHGATGTAIGVGGTDLSSLLNYGAKFTNVPGGDASWSFHDPAGNYNDMTGIAGIRLTKAAATLNLGSLTQTYGGVIEDASVVTDPANLTVLWTYDNLPLAFKPSGGTLAAYAPAVGQTIYVSVTGATGGTTSGAGFGPYIIDSDLNSAAALAGLVSIGQTAIVQVTISDDGSAFTFASTLPTSGFTTGPVQAGTYAVTGTVVDWNYSGTVTGVLTISPAAVVVTSDAKSKVYGSTDPLLTYQVSGLQGGDSATGILTGALARGTGEAVGSYAITQGSLVANNNYTLSFTGSALAVTPATLVVTADPQTKVYGTSEPALTFAVGGLQLGDAPATALSGALARTAGESVTGSPYAITQGTLAANANYVVTFTPSTFAITPASLAVTAATVTKVYGSADPSLLFTITNGALVAGDAFTGGLVRIAGENVGTYSIAQGTLTAGSNYTLGFAGSTLAITPKPASVTVAAVTKIYGAADPLLTGTLAGFLAADNIAATYSRTTGENVVGGPYTISATLVANPALTNYAITATTAAFTITPAPLAVVANARTKVYGSADPALTYAVTGLQFTDTAAGVLTGGLTRIAGETVLGSPYAIQQGTLLANTNYTLGYTGAALTITPATATIAVNGYTGIYDAHAHGATGTATGVGSANLASMLNLGASFTNVPGGTAAWTFHDAAGNYSDASGSVAITLTKAVTTIAVTPYTVIYDGNAHTATGTAKGVLGETLAGLSLTGTAHTNVGTFTDTWTFTDTTGNYAAATGTVSDTINKAAATIAVASYGVVYDTHAHTATGTAKGVKGETLAGLNLSGTTHTNAGSYPDTWTFVDATGNYATASGSIIDAITKAQATIVLSALSQMYDGQPNPVTATTTPTGLTVVFTYGSTATAPTLPGSYTVTATINDPNYMGSATATLTVGVTALIRHGLTLDGDVDGSVQVMTAENNTFNGNAGITGDLLVPGLPTVRLNGNPTFGGTRDGTGAATPTNYTVTLNGNALLRYLIRRTDALTMPTVAAPANPTGTRSVNLNKSTDPIGTWSTVKDLTLNGNVGNITVPAGVYGNLTSNGGSAFILGVAGATTPSVYELQSLTINGNASLNIVGPVILIVKNGINFNGNAGASGHPEWLDLRVNNGSVTLNGNVTFHGNVTAPSGTVTINGNSTLTGNIAADKLVVNGNGVLIQSGH